jgi:Transglutaminase-like superfamily
MSSLKPSELSALISLLDDNDREVLSHVSDKLLSLGMEGIPLLEAAWETSDNQVIQKRLEDLIDTIQFENVYDRMYRWASGGGEDLLTGALLVARCHYPELDEAKVNSQIERIVQQVWINLAAHMSPLEEIRVFNKVLFAELGFKGNRDPEPEPDLAYLNAVLDTRHGNSIGLGIVYLIVAKALDLNMYGINLPYHFILCYTDKMLSEEELQQHSAEGAVKFYINPLLEGVPFSRVEITRYLEQSKIDSKPEYYAPCNHIEIIKTLIFNQMMCYEEKGDLMRKARMKALLEIFETAERHQDGL